MSAEIVCDWCKNLTPLDRIHRRFRRWPAIGPTQFICDDCRAAEVAAQYDEFDGAGCCSDEDGWLRARAREREGSP